MKPRFFRWFGWMLVAGAIGLTGCQTADQADTGALASVMVPGYSVAEIHQAAVTVFLANGYQQTRPLVFEKPGTSWDTAAYSGWTMGDVWIRIRVYIASPKADGYSLSCNAYMVTDWRQAGLEREQKLSNTRRSECKKILKQIKARLNSQPRPGGY